MDEISQLARLLDPLALALVVGGAVLAAVLREGPAAIGPAFAALKPLLRARPEADTAAATGVVSRVEAIASAKSIVCADRIAATPVFLQDALRRLSDARSAEAFARWGADMLDMRRRRHAARARFWRDVADAAPAMGMVATVLGLIRMFAAMDDPARLGAPLASALVATLWGLVVANLLAGPISDRLERLSEAELAWQQRAIDHFTALARAELAPPSVPVLRPIAA